MIIIPRDVIHPKPKTWTEDYITVCLLYHPVIDKRCWDKDKKHILDHHLSDQEHHQEPNVMGWLSKK